MAELGPLARLNAAKQSKDWWSARDEIERLLAEPSGGADLRYLRQQLALCTYKDPELRRRAALDHALDMLFEGGVVSLGTVGDAETAGLVGAVCKRRWELDGREEHLRDALRWYERGAALAATPSAATWDGYLDIDAAFTADILAHARDDESSAELRARARHRRGHIVERLAGTSADDWWATATLLEAHIGLGNRTEYLGMLERVRTFAGIAGTWERESTAVQLARLAGVLSPPVAAGDLTAVIRAVVPEAHDDAVDSFGRRFGVALSGGGFRASLFHLGVLAAFAEHDLLRPLEVLSCVSGGSIVGTAYYSAVATLLGEKVDADITRDDLVAVMHRCIDVMQETVTTRNIRMQAFFSPSAIGRGWWHRRWSRTRRGGMLYERYVYRPLRPDGVFDTLDGLKIHPRGTKEFRPKVHNWQRSAKVPTLLINATSLGTGRPWRFTASSLGEPDDDPTVADSDPDPIDRLEPIWLDRAGSAGAVERRQRR